MKPRALPLQADLVWGDYTAYRWERMNGGRYPSTSIKQRTTRWLELSLQRAQAASAVIQERCLAAAADDPHLDTEQDALMVANLRRALVAIFRALRVPAAEADVAGARPGMGQAFPANLAAFALNGLFFRSAVACPSSARQQSPVEWQRGQPTREASGPRQCRRCLGHRPNQVYKRTLDDPNEAESPCCRGERTASSHIARIRSVQSGSVDALYVRAAA
jgi:hypothetical protein